MAKVLWFTGMSGAGKTTLANMLAKRLKKEGASVLVLDGDILRNTIHRKFDFSPEGIKKNNAFIVKLCKKHLSEFDYILVAVISPFLESRKHARKVLKDNFFEIFVKASLSTLIKRDYKGLYKKALNHEIPNFIGIAPNVPYQEPENLDLLINTELENKEQSIDKIIKFISQINEQS